jgi:hypothetical protein
MLGVLNNKRLFKSNKLLNYSLQSTYKSINEKLEREKKNSIDRYINQKNDIKIITVKQKIINVITIFSITSVIFYFINSNK